MKSKQKVNININKDDSLINDFLEIWGEIGKRPSKINLFRNFEQKKFCEFVQNLTLQNCVTKDIIPLEDGEIINIRHFTKIQENIWITYTHFDSDNDEGFVGEVGFIFDYDESEVVNSYVDILDEFIINDEAENQIESSNFFSVTLNQNGFELDWIQPKKIEFDDFENYYNDNVYKNIKKLNRNLQKKSKGLNLVFGERGTGKSSIIHYLSKSIDDKKIIFIPNSLFELTFNNPEFRNFLKKNNNSIIVLDDCEIFFNDLNLKSNIFSNNLLQFIDGIDSDNFNLNFILIFNTNDESDIDEQLLSCNNLNQILEITSLKKSKIVNLCKSLGNKTKFEESTRLIDIINDKKIKDLDQDIGFK